MAWTTQPNVGFAARCAGQVPLNRSPEQAQGRGQIERVDHPLVARPVAEPDARTLIVTKGRDRSADHVHNLRQFAAAQLMPRIVCVDLTQFLWRLVGM